MAHLPADSPSVSGPDGRHIVLVISEQQQKRVGGVSVASSDIFPSDSVSVWASEYHTEILSLGPVT